MSIELLCCFGLMEKDKPEKQAPVIIEQTRCVVQPAEAYSISIKARPIQISINVQ